MITDDLTNKWNKGELTTPKYIRVLQEHAMSLEEQIKGLQSLLDLKQQEISVLESKVEELVIKNSEAYRQGADDVYLLLTGKKVYD